MKTILFIACLLCPLFVWGSEVRIVSPESAQTYSYSDITWHSLHWDAGRRTLFADITFSTYNYVTRAEPLHEESYQFAFPGVKFDSGTNTFFAVSPHGHHVAVARFSNDLIGESIKPLPGTVIRVFKSSGKVNVLLTATDIPPRNKWQLHWVEENGGFFLDNAVQAGVHALQKNRS